MKTKPVKKVPKKTDKPEVLAVPEVPPLTASHITGQTAAVMAPRHVGGVMLRNLPREAWPMPSPVELATVTAACGWVNEAGGPGRAMALLWQCAEVIHESRDSAALFVDSIREKNEWTAEELRKACGFEYQKLPDRISHAAFMSRFNQENLKVKGVDTRGVPVFDHWHSLPEGGGVPKRDAKAWHARYKDGFECAEYSAFDRWDSLALMVIRFKEWRKKTARENNPGKKNLKRGKEFS